MSPLHKIRGSFVGISRVFRGSFGMSDYFGSLMDIHFPSLTDR